MPIKLSSAHYRLIGLALVVVAASFAVTHRYFRRTFPEASIDLKVDRADSESIARTFLVNRGIRVDGYRHTAAFTYDDFTKLYLEKAFGLERLNRLTAGPIHLWRWSNRWFQPQQQEEYSVDVTPAGEVVGFHHVIPETQPGENLDTSGARKLAETFLIQIMKRDLSDFELLESQENKRPARTDHEFTWKQKSVDLADGSLRLSVSVAGDKVVRYTEYVKIPQQWSRDYERLRSRNASAQTIDEAFFFLLSVAMAVMLIIRLRNHDVPLRTAAGFGLVGGLLYFLSQANNFPLAESSYPTTVSYSSFVANYFTGSAMAALGVTTFIFLLVATAEPEYRQSFPNLISLRRYFSWSGLRTRSFFLANIVGLTLAFFFFAYQTVFYFCANRLGAWAPSDIPFTNELNTRVPWMAVLFMGFFPAVSEEMQFRAFAVPFLARLARSLPVAIVLAAFNWGFLHSAYPNQPFFIRGVEVGTGGILIGFVMVRFGIVATLIWHYSVDALYSAFLLLRSPNHYLMFSGALTAGIMLIPLGVSLTAYLRSGTFADDSEFTNAQQSANQGQPVAPPKETPTRDLAYAPLPRQRLILAAIVVVIFVAVSCIPVYEFGEGIKVKMTAQEVVGAANAYLRTQGIKPETYRHVAHILENFSPETVRYFTEHLSVRQADQVYRSATQAIGWEIRYFRPLEIPEQHIFFDATNGGFIDHRFSLDENAPGAFLDMSQARPLAEKALQEHGYRLSHLEFEEGTGQKRKAREDYTFTWRAKPGDPRNVAEAQYRVRVDIAGDDVIGVSDWFKLPEEWLREQGKTGLMNTLLGICGVLLGIVMFVRAIILFVGQVRHGHIPWQHAAWLGILTALAVSLSELNSFPTMEQGYSTSIPLSTFWLQFGVQLVIAPVLAGLGTWLLVALALSMFPEAERLLRRSRTRVWRRDATVAVLLSLAVAAGFDTISALLTSHWPKYFPPTFDLAPGILNLWSPALGVFLPAVSGSVAALAALGVLFAILRSGWHRKAWWLWFVCLLFAITLGPAHAHSLREFLVPWTYAAVSFSFTIWLLMTFFRDNLLAYLASIFGSFVAKPAVELMLQGARTYHWNGLLLVLLSALILAWMLWPERVGEPVASAANPI